MTYKAPLKDMLFNIEHLADISQVAKIPAFEDAGLPGAVGMIHGDIKSNERLAVVEECKVITCYRIAGSNILENEYLLSLMYEPTRKRAN